MFWAAIRPALRCAGLIGGLWMVGSAHGQAMVEGKHYEFKPAEYSAAAPPTLGPDKAKGLVIWNHGRGETAAGEKASPLARYFGQQGWDVYTLYRSWGNDDRSRALQIVQNGIERARAMGYRRIVLMGQSAGAYASIEAVRYGSEVEAVIATAPAAHGGGSTPNSAWRQNDFTMRTIWEKYDGKRTKVVVAYFSDDDYYEAHAPNVRGPWLEKTLQGFGVPHFIINQPAVADLKGHGAGQSWNFTRRFGPCIYAFVETGAPPPCSEGDPAMLKTFRIALPAKPRREGAAAAYAGLWYGTWGGGRVVAIPIGPATNAQLQARYITGLGAADTEAAENSNWPLTLTETGLRRESTSTVFEFRLEGERLLGTRTQKNDPSKRDTIVLQRAD